MLPLLALGTGALLPTCGTGTGGFGSIPRRLAEQDGTRVSGHRVRTPGGSGSYCKGGGAVKWDGFGEVVVQGTCSTDAEGAMRDLKRSDSTSCSERGLDFRRSFWRLF